MIEIATLATMVVSSFLVPLAKQGVERLTEELSDKGGAAAATGLVGVAKTLWSRLRGKTEGTTDEPIVDLFEKQPDILRTALTEVLQRLLTDDSEFREQVSQLVEGQQAGSTNWQLMGEYVGAVDARGAIISGGQVAAVVVNQGGGPEGAGDRARSPSSGRTSRNDT